MYSRREFLKTIVRTVSVASITAVSGYLLMRENSSDENCDFDFICKKCKKLKTCNLPEAKQFKQTTNGELGQK